MGKTAADLGGTAEDLLPDNRSGTNHIVKDNGHAFAHVVFGEFGKNPAAPGSKVNGNIGFIELIGNSHLGIFYHFSRHQDLVVKEDGADDFIAGLHVRIFFNIDSGIFR